MSKKEISPEKVFTPRSDAVHEDMYVRRPDLEEALRMSLRMPKHIVIHGESGSGKSWLYKSLFQTDGIYYDVVNLGRANAVGSIAKLIESTLARLGDVTKTGYTEGKSAEVSAVFAKGDLNHSSAYRVSEVDVFEKCLKLLRKKAGKKGCCLVFDNLEHILADEALISELAGLILLVDDSNYAKYKVKLIFVGTPADIRSYISRATKSNTITNRLNEIPEVARLSTAQSHALIKKGLFELLSYEMNSSDFDEGTLVRGITHFSDRIPQYIQELCLYVSLRAEANGGLISQTTYEKALFDWMRSSLVSEVAVVEKNLNAISTRKGRRNQIIYALGRCPKYEFSCSDIEKIVRAEFPHSTNAVALNVAQILSELSSSNCVLLRRSPNGSLYRFVDPKLRITVRWKILKVDGEEKLLLRTFDESIAF